MPLLSGCLSDAMRLLIPGMVVDERELVAEGDKISSSSVGAYVRMWQRVKRGYARRE